MTHEASSASRGERTQGFNHEALKLAYDYSWSWYVQHSNQRMQSVNYYLITSAFLAAAYATLSASDSWAAAAVVGLSGAVVGVLFKLLDSRTKELLDTAEPALIALEGIIAEVADVDVRILQKSSRPHRRMPGYRVPISILMYLGSTAFLAGGIAALVAASH